MLNAKSLTPFHPVATPKRILSGRTKTGNVFKEKLA